MESTEHGSVIPEGLNWQERGRRWLPLLLILAGVLARAAAFGSAPAGFNQDEAFAGYEAWCLLTQGVDSWGYPFPCYFVSWGSGMNVLESYLAIPFMALLGCTPVALRLPQLILGCLSLPVFYDLLRRMASRRMALIGLGLLAVSPWHIMLSRWGLESNLAPAFLLLGFYFLVRGLEDNRWLLASAAAYGVSLYAYAITWVVVPLTLVVCGVYLLAARRRFAWRYLLGAAAILFVLALPLMLFLLVNRGILDEIVTPWLSIPRLVAMRGSELSPAHLLSAHSYWDLANVVFLQRDFMQTNAMDGFGMFYPLSLPFLVLGLVRMLAGAVRAARARAYSWQGLTLLAAACPVLICLLFDDVNINRSNCLHLYTLVIIAAGVDWLAQWGRRGARRWLPGLAAAGYACSFALFLGAYFTTYNQQIAAAFREGVGQAVAFVQERDFERVQVDSSVYYSQILFFDQTPQEEFRSTAVYTNYPSTVVEVQSFGRYTFGADYDQLAEDTAYLAPESRAAELEAAGFQLERFGGFVVAWQEP